MFEKYFYCGWFPVLFALFLRPFSAPVGMFSHTFFTILDANCFSTSQAFHSTNLIWPMFAQKSHPVTHPPRITL